MTGNNNDSIRLHIPFKVVVTLFMTIVGLLGYGTVNLGTFDGPSAKSAENLARITANRDELTRRESRVDKIDTLDRKVASIERELIVIRSAVASLQSSGGRTQ